MITFTICLCILIAGYFLYGKIAEKVFGVNPNRTTPAYNINDGVDFIPMNPIRVFIIQFLNIAGVGPIFGAILGAKFGITSFFWIALGSVFIGGIHDFIPGMISLRKNGVSLAEIHGEYLGNFTRRFMRIFLIFFCVLVGVVFVMSPAMLLEEITPDFFNKAFWIVIIFIYYIIATLLPIDKIIGKIYPIFGVCLLFMAIAILVALFINHPNIPEFWQGAANIHPQKGELPIFPVLFITIACGAVSGFHPTQSSLMARCLTNEKYGRPIFYGSMITEGIVALVWAAAATAFFHNPEYTAQGIINQDPASIVNLIANTWLGKLGAIFAILGVICAPISTGDTAFRSARLMAADVFNLEQKSISKRLILAVPLFAIAILFLIYNMKAPDSFNSIWRFFSLANQIIAAVTLWAITVYLHQERKNFIITIIPAIFMTLVTTSFIFISPTEGFGLNPFISYSCSILLTIAALFRFLFWKRKYDKTRAKLQN